MAARMQGRRFLITGAASGQGKAIAELFAAEGAAVAMLDRDGDKLKGVAAAIGARDYVCDVADAASVQRAVRDAAGALGGIDGLVNGAGVFISKPFAELDPETFQRLIGINLLGPYHVIRAALSALQAAPKATIVNIASVSGFYPQPGVSGYGATKAGLLMLTKSMALELGPKIRVNAICPGVIRTEMTRYLWESAERTANAIERVALKRIGEPEDIARTALYLSTDDSGFMTGEALTVDGGFSWQ
jgi:NAD(P)-dependent dehydrogenase (short-subunit alcohol dehydrogenase family)